MFKICLGAVVRVLAITSCFMLTINTDAAAEVDGSVHYIWARTNPGSNWRRKRASRIILGVAVLEGLKAAKALVKGGKQIPVDTNFRVYEKFGSMDRALKDFGLVKYTETLKFKMPGKGYGITGNIGDRQVVLQSAGETGKPTLDIIKIVQSSNSRGKKSVYGKLTDRIIYED